MIATLTGKNTQDVDILALNPTTGAMISIQVKEKSTNVPGFYVSNKTEIIDRQKRLGIWYICVDLFNQNKCYIANTDQIFTGAMQREKEYLHRNNGLCEKGKRKGEPKKPSPSLWFIPELDGVKENNWEELPIFKATTEWT